MIDSIQGDIVLSEGFTCQATEPICVRTIRSSQSYPDRPVRLYHSQFISRRYVELFMIYENQLTKDPAEHFSR